MTVSVRAEAPTCIVGAGLAGLACARELTRAGRAVRVFEAADAPGGRVRTDTVDGFRLDRGFQVFFTAYPEARRVLDLPALRLHPFLAGAQVRVGGAFYRVLDPYRAPVGALAGIAAPVGTLADKLRVLRLRRRALAMSEREIFAGAERRTSEELSALGFTETFVARFFRPFLGGIFLDTSLSTTSRMLYFVYKMLSSGDIALPATGMQAIPAQLAAALPEDTIRCGTRVAVIDRVDGRAAGIRLATGEVQPASAVVVATDVAQAAALTGLSDVPAPRSVTCVYFSAPVSPVRGPLLVLDGEGRGPVLNLAVPSNVAPGYAPAGRHLISATIVGALEASDEVVERDVRVQMTEWFGAAAVRDWRHLRTYRIPWAQFDQSPGRLDPAERDVRLGGGVCVCGDHREQASINGALHAGRRAAEAVLADAGADAR